MTPAFSDYFKFQELKNKQEPLVLIFERAGVFLSCPPSPLLSLCRKESRLPERQLRPPGLVWVFWPVLYVHGVPAAQNYCVVLAQGVKLIRDKPVLLKEDINNLQNNHDSFTQLNPRLSIWMWKPIK